MPELAHLCLDTCPDEDGLSFGTAAWNALAACTQLTSLWIRSSSEDDFGWHREGMWQEH